MEPYLKLGPFWLEVKFASPFRSVIQDFFTEKGIEWMVNYSKPRLSSSRAIITSNEGKLPWEQRYRDEKTGSSVGKTVQTWFDDIAYNETEQKVPQISLGADICNSLAKDMLPSCFLADFGNG